MSAVTIRPSGQRGCGCPASACWPSGAASGLRDPFREAVPRGTGKDAQCACMRGVSLRNHSAVRGAAVAMSPWLPKDRAAADAEARVDTIAQLEDERRTLTHQLRVRTVTSLAMYATPECCHSYVPLAPLVFCAPTVNCVGADSVLSKRCVFMARH